MFKQWFKRKPASFKKAIILMQDSALPHAFKYTTSWLAQKGFKDSKVWPPASTDLNPIENNWHGLYWSKKFTKKGSNIRPWTVFGKQSWLQPLKSVQTKLGTWQIQWMADWWVPLRKKRRTQINWNLIYVYCCYLLVVIQKHLLNMS